MIDGVSADEHDKHNRPEPWYTFMRGFGQRALGIFTPNDGRLTRCKRTYPNKLSFQNHAATAEMPVNDCRFASN